MTDKLIMTIEQFDTILTLLEDSTIGYKDFRKIADVMQSLPMVDSEPVAYLSHYHLDPTMHTEADQGFEVVDSMAKDAFPVYTSPIPANVLKELHHVDKYGLFCSFDHFELIVKAIEHKHGIIKRGSDANA